MTRFVSLCVALAACCPPPKARPTAPTPVAEPAPPAPLPAAQDALPWPDDFEQPPAAAPDLVYVPPAAESFSIAGGPKVILISNPRLPLVSLRVAFPGAGAIDAPPGLASLTADLMMEGAGAYDAQTLPEALERIGADLGVFAGADAMSVGLSALASQLPAAIALLADVIRRPRLAAADFARVQGDALEALAQRADDPNELADLAFDRHLFAGGAYEHPVDGYARTVKPLRLADVKAFWARAFVPAEATLVIAGDVRRADLEPLLSRALGGTRAKARPRQVAGAAPPPPTLVVVDKPGAEQSVVVIGRRTPRAQAPDVDDDALELGNTALGGTFASRLNARLREELGYTYGIGSSFWRARFDGAWTVRSSIRTDVTVAGIREALAIIARTRAEPLPAAEFAKAQSYLVRQLPQGFETNRAIVGAFADLARRERPLDDHARYAARLGALTPASVHAQVAPLWDGLSVVVVGDWKVLRAELEQLGLPIEHRDVDGERITR